MRYKIRAENGGMDMKYLFAHNKHNIEIFLVLEIHPKPSTKNPFNVPFSIIFHAFELYVNNNKIFPSTANLFLH